MATVTLAQQASEAPAASDPLIAGSVQGEDAIRRLGAALPDLAARSGLTASELAETLRQDGSLWIAPDGGAHYTCFAGHVHDGDEASSAAGMLIPAACSSPTEIPLDETFELSSVPGATKTIYLDFDGHHSVNNDWGHDIVFPSYNTEGSSSTFTSNELREIRGIWWRVVEDFAPFDVNVTTIDPGVAALTRVGSDDESFGIRCVMTQATGGFGGGIGGIAFLNSFDDSIDNPVFGFNKGINNGSMTASHEVGHALGLVHDGLFGSTYHPGSGSGETSWGPIMGAPFGQNIVHWSNGDYDGATSAQQDLQIITQAANGFGFHPDDHDEDLEAAESLEPDVAVDGVISERGDLDAFRIATAGGSVTIAVHPVDPGPNLDIRLKLYGSSGSTLVAENPLNQVAATMSLDLDPGVYYVRVDGTGKSGVYSDYGSIGQYCITASFEPGVPCPADLDESGDVGVSDLLLVLGAWGGADGDVTGDGTTDVADLLAVLSAWGACA